MHAIREFHYHRVNICLTGKLKGALYLKVKPPKGWRRRRREWWDSIDKNYLTDIQLINYDPGYSVSEEEWEQYRAKLLLVRNI